MDATGRAESKHVGKEPMGVSWFGLIIYVSHRPLSLAVLPVSREGGPFAAVLPIG